MKITLVAWAYLVTLNGEPAKLQQPHHVNFHASQEHMKVVEAAFSAWTNQPTSFSVTPYSYDDVPEPDPDCENGYQRCANGYWEVKVMTDRWDHTSGALAEAITFVDRVNGAIVEGDIYVNAFEKSIAMRPEDLSLENYDLQGILTHEIGHSIGIGHSSVEGAVMWPSLNEGEDHMRHLHEDDVEAVSTMYPEMKDGLDWGCSMSRHRPARGRGTKIGMAMIALAFFVLYIMEMRKGKLK